MNFQILIVDDEKEMCLSLSEILISNGFDSFFTTNPLEAPALLNSKKTDLIIMDIKMPRIHGIDLLKKIKAIIPSIPIIMISGYASIENAVNSMKYGALNFYEKPIKVSELVKEIRQLANSLKNARQKEDNPPLVTQNSKMQQILLESTKAGPTNAPVLITGESGTGKELVAYSLYHHSTRKNKPFINVNCASIPDNLLESELFGHEKGSFTDAINKRIGKFELANHGTIFLDEIGDMSIETQPKMLRVLQDGEIQRLGGSGTIQTDVRIISATNKNIGQMIKEKGFREDLYYRLSVVTIHLPPLRERKDDLFLLANHFLEYFNRIYSKNIEYLSDNVKGLFASHNWPGNIRELKNCIERAVIFSDVNERTITSKHLPSQYLEVSNDYSSTTLEELYDNLSKDKIIEALAKSDGVKHKAAELLNIHRKTLYNKMKKLGME